MSPLVSCFGSGMDALHCSGQLQITLLYSRRPTDLRHRKVPAALAQLVGADVSG